MSNALALPRLSPDAARRVDQTCDRFEAVWKAGERPRPEEYLGAVGEPERSALLRQLLMLDWDYRRRAADEPRPGDYHERFPDDSAVIDDVGRQMNRSRDSAFAGSGGDHSQDTPWCGDRLTGRDGEAATAAGAGPARYDLVEEVGRGGIGVVYRARDGLLGRELAVKVLCEGYRDHPEARRRFVVEARVGSQLQHPAIVPVYELGWFDDRRPYLAMRLVEGQTFAALLHGRADPTQDLRRWLGVFEQVCQAVAYAHSRGVVHRDLKPANVMVGAFGEVQVMDWGFAKQLAIGDRRPTVDDGGEESSEIRDRQSELGTPAGVTHSGGLMGTPAYMPPEQARGEGALVDRRSDVFALGAILCEVLTGHPPYLAGSTDELCRKAAEGDLAAAHARLDASAADEGLRELAKRCLAAGRDARPPDGASVARDLTAYLTSAQERLRQAQLERAAADARTDDARATAQAERRARRLTLALAATAAAVLALAGAGWWWRERVQRSEDLRVAATDGKVEAALAEAADHMNRNDWPQSRAAATRARELVESGASDHWKPRVDELLADLDMVARIDEVRLIQGTYDFESKRIPWEKALPRYAEAFARYGIHSGADPAEVAARIAQRPAPVHDALVGALDNWWLIARTRDEAAHGWLGTVLQAADSDEWRKRVRRAVTLQDRRPLVDLAAKEDVAARSPAAVNSLTWALVDLQAHDAVIAVLRPAQLRHPNDFWINYDLANALLLRQPSDPTEALRFFSVARALRPDLPMSIFAKTYINLGSLFLRLNDWDGAIFVSRKALEVEPNRADAYNHLGLGLAGKGDWREAEAAYRKAIELDPNLAPAHCNLGKSFCSRGEVVQAVAAFREAVRLDPRIAEYHANLGNAHYAREDYDAALAAYDQAVELKAGLALAHVGRGNVLTAKKQYSPAAAAYSRAIRLDPTMDKAHSGFGMLSVLVGDANTAVVSCRKAVELNPRSAVNHYSLGRALEVAKSREAAITSYRESLRLDPTSAEAYCHLHRVLRDTGRYAEALAAIEQGHRLGSARPGWHLPSGAWLIETRRCIALEAKLPAILAGSEKPATVHEQLEYAFVSRVKSLYAASARLYAGAFAADPKPATALGTNYRYQAACAAALAGTADGKDDPKPDAPERARWRKQAVEWLRADLALWADRVNKTPRDRSSTLTMLSQWRRDQALAGIREPAELARLPEPERADYIRFWAEVQELLVRSLATPKDK